MWRFVSTFVFVLLFAFTFSAFAEEPTVSQLTELHELIKSGHVTGAEPEAFLEQNRPSEKHVIDLDADPFVPDGFSIESHKKGGKLEWNPDKVSLWFSIEQRYGGAINGNSLQKMLGSKEVLNANVLYYLLFHPELIPDEWKNKAVFFWGTVYRHSDGHLCVRCLYWRGGKWFWGHGWLNHDFYDISPAAVFRK